MRILFQDLDWYISRSISFDGVSFCFFSDLHWSGVCGTDFDSNGDKWFASPLGITIMTAILLQFMIHHLVSFQKCNKYSNDFDNKWIGTGSGISVLDANNSIASNILKCISYHLQIL